MNISICLFPKVYKNGLYPVMLRFIHGRKVRYKEVFTIKREDWDEKKREVRKSNPLFAQLNLKISAAITDAKSRYMEMEMKGLGIDSDYIMGKRSTIIKVVTFGDAFKWFIEAKSVECSTGTIMQYERMYRTLHPLLGNVDILNVHKYYNEIFRYMSEVRGNNYTTIINKIILINMVILWYNKDWGKQVNIISYTIKKNETQKNRLTVDEIESLIRFDGLSYLEKRARSAWLFQFYLHGARVADVLLLKKEDVRGRRIDYIQKKRKVNMSILVHEELDRIIDEQLKESGVFLFSFMEEFMATYNGEDKERFEDKIITCSGRINYYLNKVLKRMGVTKRITNHCARHSFAKIADSNKVPLRHIQKALGHKKLSTTELYLGQLRDDEIDDTIAVVYEKRQQG